MDRFDRPPTPPVEFSRENFLSREIPRQHEDCVTSLRNVGLLEEIVLDQGDLVLEMREGITGMDGKKYALPTAEKIAKHFRREKYRDKIEQGFTKLLIVPFGYPLATLRIRYTEQLLKHHREGKLFDRDNKPLELDVNEPLFVWEEFNNSDESGELIYYPTQFDDAHGGKTKQELLNDRQQPFPGFHVLLIKSDFTIRRERSREAIGTRKDMETEKHCDDYLKLLKEPQYQKEQGFTIEDSIALGMIHLDQTNQVIDDWENKKDSYNLNVANFHPESGLVPASSWGRQSRHTGVFGRNPEQDNDFAGMRSVVA